MYHLKEGGVVTLYHFAMEKTLPLPVPIPLRWGVIYRRHRWRTDEYILKGREGVMSRP